MKCQIITLDDPTLAEYDQFIRSHKNGHFLQTPEWAAVKPLWQWYGITVRNGSGDMVAAMSILCRRLPLGFSMVYSPRGPVCQRNSKAVIKALVQGLREFARWQHCLLTYTDPDESEDNLEFCKIMKNLGFRIRHGNSFEGIQPHSVFRMSLDYPDADSLLSSFTQKTRYNIRLAIRKGVTVASFSGEKEIPADALTSFSLLMRETGRRDHFPVRSRSYFETLLTALGRDSVLHLAYYEGQPIAGSIAVYYGNKGWYLYGASANQHRDVMPNYLLQWTMICEAKIRNCTIYDFRGVPGTGQQQDPLYGLYRFKKGFCGTHTRFAGLYTYYHSKILGRLLDFGYRRLRKLFHRK